MKEERKAQLIEPVKKEKKELLVKEVRFLTDTTYVISLERKGIKFIPGQYMTLGLVENKEMREYSIYSGMFSDRLEFLIKEVNDGDVSKQLKKLSPVDFIAIDGPFGFFSIDRKSSENKKHLFIASGTGISPFHSIALSYRDLNYKIIHGIKTKNEEYEKQVYPAGRYLSCVSREKTGNFHGHVTDYLKKNPVDKDTLCYLCGNSNMIYDVFDILRNQDVPSGNVFMEVYF